ncbi:Crp/Fnr family transcriptional regulator [Listeria grandensis]|uniref:Crp/Fnr family transcriptional regulator n=1 Tax=Listeria grandensis TaxID=1494963 RepID=A0A7X1CQG9_9LIST|nr:Crp/Fnr family transcriptional regulator [Listeria grandensis]MBC1475077.1 Crp/Fnr family transcriptional regulator [Listeria grandensis]MBC1937014.1 Crp/Fnr family transcriptional regulator [Listeria grandensis]
MSYMQLFDKDVMDRAFNSDQLIRLLLDKKTDPIEFQPIKLAKRDVLFLENLIHDYIYIVKKGFFSHSKGNHVISFTTDKEIIGMDSILGNEVSFFTVEALTESKLWRFSKEDVMRKLMSTQEGVFYLYNDMKAINEYLVQRNVFQMVDTKDRIMACLIQLGKRYGEENDYQIKLPKTLTRKIIANYLNITITTMYFLCKQLIQDGFLEANSQALVVKKAGIMENKLLVPLL